MPGFHSNADHGAKLGYTVVNTVGDQTTETPGSVEYPHPVLQVKTGKIQVTKDWSDGAEKHGNGSVTVTLKQCNAQGEDCKDVNRTVTLNNQGQWAGAFENLAPGTYRVEESRVDGYTASYNPENQLVTVTADDLWAAPDNNNMTTFDNVKTYPVTITNTFVAVSALPMTGGATTRDWLVYGGGFGLARGTGSESDTSSGASVGSSDLRRMLRPPPSSGRAHGGGDQLPPTTQDCGLRKPQRLPLPQLQ